MRIAFVSTIMNWPWGGADALWTRAAEGAAERGDPLLLSLSSLTAAHDRIGALRARGARLAVRSPLPPRRGLLARAWRRLAAAGSAPDPVVAALADFAPDLVIVSCGGTYDLVAEPALCAWLRAHQVRHRLILNWQRENPTEDDAVRAAITPVFAGAERIFFVSTRNLEATRAHLRQPLAHATVLHNPLRWTAADASPWPGSPPWRLATVSRLSPEKGLDLLLRATAAALPRDGSWELNLHGTGPEEAHLRATAEQCGLAASVHFRGHVARLADLWRDNHLLVSPALEEGVPMTIPEAMLCGRPVLATAVGGARDWLRPGETGFLCPAPTQALLEASLADAWAQRADWPRLGAAAAVAAARHYRADDWRQIIA